MESEGGGWKAAVGKGRVPPHPDTEVFFFIQLHSARWRQQGQGCQWKGRSGLKGLFQQLFPTRMVESESEREAHSLWHPLPFPSHGPISFLQRRERESKFSQTNCMWRRIILEEEKILAKFFQEDHYFFFNCTPHRAAPMQSRVPVGSSRYYIQVLKEEDPLPSRGINRRASHSCLDDESPPYYTEQNSELPGATKEEREREKQLKLQRPDVIATTVVVVH